MVLRYRLAAVLLLFFLVTGKAIAAVWVITDVQHPVAGTQQPDRIIRLDAPRHVEADLSAQLPSDPQRASAIIRQRLQTDDRAQQRLQSAYQGVADAWSLGITTLPAVLVDQKYVVYGEPDLDKALARIAQYRSMEKQP
ncbi:conjugal transfer protein [Dickeya fangzhongdai]|nr:conjugal transfer protein [Dickeya fangzhongdai]